MVKLSENMCKSQQEHIHNLEKENEQLKRRSTEMEDEKLNVLRELSKMERCLETKEDLVDNLKRGNEQQAHIKHFI